MGAKLKPLPIWSLEVGQRVRVKPRVRPYGGRAGLVSQLEPGGYWVHLDLMGNSRNPHPKFYKRDELVSIEKMSDTARSVIRALSKGATLSWCEHELRVDFVDGSVWYLAKTVVKELVLAARIEERR